LFISFKNMTGPKIKNANISLWVKIRPFPLTLHVGLTTVQRLTRWLWLHETSAARLSLQQTVQQVTRDVRRYGTPTCDSCIVTWLQEHWAEMDCRLFAGEYFYN